MEAGNNFGKKIRNFVISLSLLVATAGTAGFVATADFGQLYEQINQIESSIIKSSSNKAKIERHKNFVQFSQLIQRYQISEVSGILKDIREVELPMYFYSQISKLFSVANTSTSIIIKDQILYIENENGEILRILSLNPVAYNIGDSLDLKYSKLVPGSMRELKSNHLVTDFSPVIENIKVMGIDGILGPIKIVKQTPIQYCPDIFQVYSSDMQSLPTKEELSDLLAKEEKFPLDYNPFRTLRLKSHQGDLFL